MHLQKAKSSNLARNNFSVRLRCDVLAHRSTNSRAASQSAGRFADVTISATRSQRYRQLGKNAEIGEENAAALGCRPPIRHVATRRLYRLFCLPLSILFPPGEIVWKCIWLKIVILQLAKNFNSKKLNLQRTLITFEIICKIKACTRTIHALAFPATNDSYRYLVCS